MSGGIFTASLADMQAWADGIMEREPNFIIGDDYLRRWWVIPRNDNQNVYLHDIRKSDDDRALHDHPWDNASWVLRGRYIEHLPTGEALVRNEGDFVQRPANTLHRLELYPGENAISLFMTGPKIREWGFECPQGWRHWKEFTGFNDTGDSRFIGKGCE